MTARFALLLCLALAAPAQAGWTFSTDDASATVEGTKRVEGSGHVVTQARQIGGFKAVQTKGAFDLDLQIGATTSLSVEVDDNLQGLIRTEVRDGTLVVDSTGSWSSEHSPRIHVVLPQLDAVAVDGSGDAVLKGLAGGDLALRINGSGDLDASGTVDSLSLLLNGSGDAHLGKLAAAGARVRINGSGDATVKVSGKLEAIVNGSGDIRYSGGAQVTSTIHGSGSVEKE